MISQTALLVAAGSVGILHMSAPDHWATLITLGRASKWSKSRLMEVGIMRAIGHAALSVALGFAILGVGYEFSNQVSGYVTEVIGLVMLVGGLTFAVREPKTDRKEDFTSEAGREWSKGETRFGRQFRYFAVLGAALSPDLAILPVFLLALPIGLSFAFATAIVFGLASIAALLFFLFLGVAGLARMFERIPPKYNGALVGLVIAAVGVYVLILR